MNPESMLDPYQKISSSLWAKSGGFKERAVLKSIMTPWLLLPKVQTEGLKRKPLQSRKGGKSKLLEKTGVLS